MKRKRDLIPRVHFPRLIHFATLAALAFVLAAWSSGALHAATYYINPSTGSDSNPGTQSQPWQTIPHAIASIKTGDTVILDTGIYVSDRRDLHAPQPGCQRGAGVSKSAGD